MADSKCLACEQSFPTPPSSLVLFKYTLEQLTGGSKGTNKSKAEKDKDKDKDKNKDKDKEIEKNALHEFRKVINSFLNSKEGSILIHCAAEADVDLLDQKIDDKLLTLIPDNALYQDVYERDFLDSHHLYYRVKPRHPERPLSILDSKTKFAVSKGVVDPTQGQMRDFLKHTIEGGEKSPSLFESYRGTAVLKKGQPATLVPQAQGQSSQRPSRPFRENICTQAKRYIPGNGITEYCWAKSNLYISAFSKIPGGGSVYIGIKEEKKGDLTTGRLIVEGVELEATRTNEEAIQTALLDRVEREFMQVGKCRPVNPVIEVKALPVTEDGSVVVIQIKVNYYHGVYFTSPDGPEIYQAKWKSPRLMVIEAIDVRTWLKQFRPRGEVHIHPRQATGLAS